MPASSPSASAAAPRCSVSAMRAPCSGALTAAQSAAKAWATAARLPSLAVQRARARRPTGQRAAQHAGLPQRQQQQQVHHQVPGDHRPHRRRQQVDALRAADVVDQQAESQAESRRGPGPAAMPARQGRRLRSKPAQGGLRACRQEGLGRRIGAHRLQRAARGPGAVGIAPARVAAGFEGAQQQHLAGGLFVHAPSCSARSRKSLAIRSKPSGRAGRGGASGPNSSARCT